MGKPPTQSLGCAGAKARGQQLILQSEELAVRTTVPLAPAPSEQLAIDPARLV